MKLIRYTDIRNFLAKTETLLVAHESLNNLMLGVCFQLRDQPGLYEKEPFLGAVLDAADEIVVAAVMTPPHKFLLYSDRESCAVALALLVEHLIAEGWSVPGVLGPQKAASTFAQLYADAKHLRIRPGMHLRTFELQRVIRPPLTPGEIQLVKEADLDLVTTWMQAFHAEATPNDPQRDIARMMRRKVEHEDVYLWVVAEKPVSMVMRTRPTVNGITVTGVYTPPELRRRGYASACVAAFSQHLLDSGYQFCNLFTDLSNPVSNSIYQKIGYRSVGDFVEFFFEGRND